MRYSRRSSRGRKHTRVPNLGWIVVLAILVLGLAIALFIK